MSVKLPVAASLGSAPLSKVVSGVGAPLRRSESASGPASNARHTPIVDEQSNGSRAKIAGNNRWSFAPGHLQPVLDASEPEVADHLQWVYGALASKTVPVNRDRVTTSAVMAALLDAPDPIAALRQGIISVNDKAEVRRLEPNEFGQPIGGRERVVYAAVRTGDEELHVAITDEGMFHRLTDAKKQ